MAFYKNGNVSFHGLDTLQSTFGMDIKGLNDGSVWARIHYLDVSSNATFFTDEAEVLECTDKTNRYSLMKYVDSFKTKIIKMTNMLPAINGTTGFSSSFATASTAHVKYGSSALLLTGTTSNVEVTASSTATYALDNTHKYYARVEIYQETAQGSSDFYWPIAEPYMYSGKPVSAAGVWTIISNVKDRSSFTNGSYPFRLDYNNSSVDGKMWFDGVMLIDLTEAFGSGCEPTAAWCDANIPYFTGTKEIEAQDATNARYEFMLTHPRFSTTLYNRWTQTSSPNDATVTGFRAITTAWSAHNAGIRKHGSNCIYDCDSGTTWYSPIGQLTRWDSTRLIPCANGADQSMIELWVRIDNLSNAEIARMYDGYFSAVDFIEY